MTTMELKSKLEAIDNIQTIIEEIRKSLDEDAVIEVLNKYGLDVTVDELTAFCLEEEGELNEESLDIVAGGGKCTYDSWVHKVIWKFCQLVGLADKNSCPVSMR